MNRIMRGWDFSRLLRTAFGLGALLVGVFSQIWFFVFIGAWLTLLPILGIGCVGSCALPEREEDKINSKNG